MKLDTTTLKSTPGDFFKKDAQTPLHQGFLAVGIPCTISTNCESILKAAVESFLPIEEGESEIGFRARFWVDVEDNRNSPWPRPHIRGWGHLVFAGFDTGSWILIDLHARRIIGRFSAKMGADRSHWKSVIFPMLMSIACGALGVAEIHGACVAQGENGLLLIGHSGSGKSTLSVTLAQQGFGFLSDDRTYCSVRGSQLTAWGLPTQLKLREDAADWFPQLRSAQLSEMKPGELAFRLQPEQHLNLTRVRMCEPRWLVFLEREDGADLDLTRMSSSTAAQILEDGLLAETPEAVEKQLRTIARLVELPSWLLRYGAQPPSVVGSVVAHCLEAGV